MLHRPFGRGGQAVWHSFLVLYFFPSSFLVWIQDLCSWGERPSASRWVTGLYVHLGQSHSGNVIPPSPIGDGKGPRELTHQHKWMGVG